MVFLLKRYGGGEFYVSLTGGVKCGNFEKIFVLIMLINNQTSTIKKQYKQLDAKNLE